MKKECIHCHSVFETKLKRAKCCSQKCSAANNYLKNKEKRRQKSKDYYKANIVSGLHAPWNLRAITAQENLSKGNKILESIT